MKNKMIPIIVVIMFLFGCQTQNPAEKIHDLIEPVSLTAGQSDTLLISDLFYTEKYDLCFLNNSFVKVKYNPQQLQLVLKPNADFEGQTLIKFTKGKNEYSIPVFVKIQQTKKFTFKPKKKYKKITLFGAFNTWNRQNLIMTDDNKDGIYEIEIPIEPGRYEYRFWVDGKEIIDPANPEKVKNPFGEYNSLINIEPRHNETAYLHLLGYKTEWPSLDIDFKYEGKLKQLSGENVLALVDNHKIEAGQISIQGQKVSLHLKKEQLQGDKAVRISVADGGIVAPMQTLFFNNSTPLSPQDDSFDWKEGILYSIMIDRFNDGDPENNSPVVQEELSVKGNYQGGDLQGVLTKIEEGYFTGLGINVIWLSPVNDNTDNAHRDWPAPHRYFSGYHGYWPTHHENIESRFGDPTLLKKVVDTAHKKGIKVILDYVSNHTHIDHPFFKEHRDWYGKPDLPDGRKNIRLFDEFRLTTWFEPFLPSFDYENSPEALHAMTDNAIWWLKQYNLDGFRHDAVKHIPNKFWRVLTQKVKREVEIPYNKKLYQVGETFGSYEMISSYVNNGQMNAQFNFNLFETARYVMLDQQVSFKILETELNKTLNVYGRNHVMGNLMDSHDKVRYMAYADGDVTGSSGNTSELGWTHPPKVDDPDSYKKAGVYLAYMFTIPGIPTLYYGDEIGMTGAADPDNRRMMRFGENLNDQENKMKKIVSNLVKLRRNHSALCYGDFLPLLADNDCFTYMRSDVNERIIVILNKNNSTQEREIELPDIYNINNAKDLISGEKVKIKNNKFNVVLNGFGYKIIKLN